MERKTWKQMKKGSAEYKQRDKEYRQEVRSAEYAERDASRKQPLSDHVLKKSEAKEILRVRIRNPHVLDVCVDLAHVAASALKIPYNDFLLRNGLRATVAARAGDTTPAPVVIANEVIDGEILYRQDLFALWDFGYFRHFEGFDEWLAIRRKAKSDVFFLGRDILSKDFHEVHAGWRDFLPQFDPSGLKPGYSQEDAKAWLARQSEKKTFVLLCSRNSYKSTFAIIWAITAILCEPCIRIRMVTETRDLALSGHFKTGHMWSLQNRPRKIPGT